MKYSVTVYDGTTTRVIFEGLATGLGVSRILTGMCSFYGVDLNNFTHELAMKGEVRIPAGKQAPNEIYITKRDEG